MSKVRAARSRDFPRGDDAGLRLRQGVLGVADFDADLLALLLDVELGLGVLELGTVLVGFGDAVADGDVELEADVVVGGGVVEGVRERSAEAAGDGGGGGGTGGYGAREAGAAVVGDGVEGGEEGIARGLVGDGAVLEVDGGFGELDAGGEGALVTRSSVGASCSGRTHPFR